MWQCSITGWPLSIKNGKKAAFLRFTFTFVFAIPAESSGGQFLMFKPTVFSEQFKIQTFSLNSNYFFVVVGNSFAQLYSSSSFMLYISWIFKGIFKKTFSWICCFGWRGIFFLSVGTIGFWVQHIVLIDTNKITDKIIHLCCWLIFFKEKTCMLFRKYTSTVNKDILYET